MTNEPTKDYHAEAMAIIKTPTPPYHNRIGFWGWVMRVIGGFFAFSILCVGIHRFVPIPVTMLMSERAIEGHGIDHKWVNSNQISDHLKIAVIASEDAKFCDHAGFDVEAIKKAEKYNARHKTKKRGASTISQQTAKNAFLWPSRDWVRKGFEVYYTFLIETLWDKKRLETVYLNVVEWGPGVYGAESASLYWFHKHAADLNAREAARLAAILPNPRKWKASASGPYVAKRSGTIVARANAVDDGGYADCVVE